ncbi:MAG TPA: PPOX class F420-dependent oxidoreductase [Anaerolineales bacterium]|jgi:pyridoxamine 5'-phosphate oxidase family protein|nr:PPOX class F420-dependent oxidoreductase [Anaerolineales bacterium]
MADVNFTQEEKDFIKSQLLLRIGTASPKGRPDVAVVGFDFDGAYFYVSGRDNENTWKYKNTRRNPRASLVIDDLPSVKPWRTRGVKVFGSVDFVHYAGRSSGEREYLRIKPERKYSWGL